MTPKYKFLLNRLATIGMFISLVQMGIFLLVLHSMFWFYASACVAIHFLIIYIINHKGNFTLAKNLYFILSSILIALFAAGLPKGSGMELYYIALLGLIFLFFNFRKEKLNFILLCTTSLVFFLISVYIEGTFEFGLEVQDKYMVFLYFANFVCTTIILAFALYNKSLVNHLINESLVESNGKLNAILDSSSDAIFLIDLNLIVLKFNKTAYNQMYAVYGKALKVGDFVLDFIAENTRAEYKNNFEKCRDTGHSVDYEREVVNEKGEFFYYEINFSPVFDDQKRTIGVLASGRNVTLKKRLEKELHFREVLLSTIFQESPDALFLTEASTKKILSCNKRTLEMFEVESEETLIKLRGIDFHHQPVSEDFRVKVEQSLQNYGVWKSEIEYKSFLGKVFWGGIEIRRITIFDKVYDLVRVADITHKIIEKENLVMLMKMEQQETLNKLKQKNLALIIESQEQERQRISRDLHDSIGQMLTAIRMQITSISTDSAIGLQQKNAVKETVDQTIAEVKRISNNLMPNVLADFGLVYAVNHLVKLVPGNIAVNFDYDNDVESLKFSQKMQISVYRIVQEALNNTIKYAHATQISVLLGFTDNNEMVLEVKDNGKGFDIATILDSNNKINIGNGIANMRERAELINAQFDIQSELGKGAYICVIIPLEKEIYEKG